MIYLDWLDKLNFLLSINKKYVLIILILFSSFFSVFFIFKFFSKIDSSFTNDNLEVSKVDITEPRFSINNINNKIFVSAKEGNFVSEDKIFLTKNVKFTSVNFSIQSDNVIFNRRDQTAKSDNNSIFKSKNTTISSEGFDIYDKGNRISFYGKSVVILKWNIFY